MKRHPWPLALLALGLAVAGCTSTQGAVPHAPTSSVAASTAQAVGPSKTALQICGDDLGGQVKQVLKLSAPATTQSTFIDNLYTCTYDLPMGPLVLSVQHSETDAVANSYFETLRTKLAPTTTLIGLGERAYGTPAGVAVVIKDNETLQVNATGLPVVFGSEKQKRTDLAYEIASDVLGCWTGDGDE
ncbi:hypothetical protein ACSMXN_08700 [Jatrophihabitans sp. DSM 45814]